MSRWIVRMTREEKQKMKNKDDNKNSYKSTYPLRHASTRRTWPPYWLGEQSAPPELAQSEPPSESISEPAERSAPPESTPKAPAPRSRPMRTAVSWTSEDDRLAAFILLLATDDLPPPPFERHPWSVVTNSHRFLEWLRRDVAMGPRSPRARYGVLRRDMQEILGIAARYAATQPPEGTIHDD